MNKRKGITLIELMVVVVIVGLIFAIASVKIIPHRKEETRIRAAKAEMGIFSVSLEMYRSDVGEYPSSSEDVSWKALIKNPFPLWDKRSDAWNGPYIKYRRFVVSGCGCYRRESLYPTDTWGNEYLYGNMDDSDGQTLANEVGEEIISGACLIVCRGADGEIGGTGWDEDIVRICIK